jgi:ketosteroid isomerase-like protein
MPSDNAEVIRAFYEAFDRHDGDAMAAMYAPEARFSDPVFPDLRGREPGQMWRMLTSRSEDLKVELPSHSTDGDTGKANWVATYTFDRTGRKVVNDIDATFRFENGLIAEHDDDFDFWRWSRQALGAPGLLLGWTPLLRRKVQQQAGAQLEKFIAADEAGGAAQT